jgi:hypothetical protein
MKFTFLAPIFVIFFTLSARADVWVRVPNGVWPDKSVKSLNLYDSQAKCGSKCVKVEKKCDPFLGSLKDGVIVCPVKAKAKAKPAEKKAVKKNSK